MDEQIDFEELIDLNLSLPSVSQSSQEPIIDVLDKMCEAIDESGLELDSILNNNPNDNNEIAPDYDIVDLDDFETLLAAASLCKDESNFVTDDILNITKNAMDKVPSDDIDLDEFDSISENACLFIDEEDTTDNNVSNVQRVLSYEVPAEFEENGDKTECDVNRQNITSANRHTISLESTATSNEKENCIDLEAFEFSPVPIKLKSDIIEYENGLKTVREECKIESNITGDIVTITINSDGDEETSVTDCKNAIGSVTEQISETSEVKYENAVETVDDYKNAIKPVTDETNKNITDSDDDYDPLDFEFISEQEASKAGIITRISQVTINETKTPSTSKDANKHQNNNCTANTSIDRPRNNEASLADYVKYSKYRYQRCYSHPASDVHVIPEGERYLDMFRGEYAPVVLNNLYTLTNKRVLSAVAMAANFEELAYRDPARIDEENEKYKDGADDCIQKILSTYPRENRRKRRRH